jgi:hypothetical protein
MLLPSDVPGENNKICDYETILPKTLKFDSDFLVALHSLTYPRSWASIGTLDNQNITLFKKNGDNLEIPVPRSNYTTDKDLVEGLNELIKTHIEKLKSSRKRRQVQVSKPIEEEVIPSKPIKDVNDVGLPAPPDDTKQTPQEKPVQTSQPIEAKTSFTQDEQPKKPVQTSQTVYDESKTLQTLQEDGPAKSVQIAQAIQDEASKSLQTAQDEQSRKQKDQDDERAKQVQDIQTTKSSIQDEQSRKEKEQDNERAKQVQTIQDETTKQPETTSPPVHSVEITDAPVHSEVVNSETTNLTTTTNEQQRRLKTQDDERIRQQAFVTQLQKLANDKDFVKNVKSDCLQFFYDELRQRVRIDILDENIERISISAQIKYVLGFGIEDNLVDGFLSKYRIDLSGDINHLAIYAQGLCTPIIVGDSLVPLLRLVTVQGEHGSIIDQHFQNLLFVPVAVTEISHIRIQIRTLEGRLIPFDHGKVICSLYFKRNLLI